jgi:DNA-binding response OmpR family regulator
MIIEGKSILVVEDDDAIRTLLVDVLTDERYTVRAAPDGMVALAILEAWSPQLIILDQLMPRMDGATFRAEQRTRPAIAQIPVLLLSAARDLPAQATILDVTATMPKPFNLDELLVITARLLADTAEAQGDDIFLTCQ